MTDSGVFDVCCQLQTWVGCLDADSGAFATIESEIQHDAVAKKTPFRLMVSTSFAFIISLFFG